MKVGVQEFSFRCRVLRILHWANCLFTNISRSLWHLLFAIYFAFLRLEFVVYLLLVGPPEV